LIKSEICDLLTQHKYELLSKYKNNIEWYIGVYVIFSLRVTALTNLNKNTLIIEHIDNSSLFFCPL